MPIRTNKDHRDRPGIDRKRSLIVKQLQGHALRGTCGVPAEIKLVVVFCDKTTVSWLIDIQGDHGDTLVLHAGNPLDLTNLPAKLAYTGWTCIRYNL